MSTTDNTEINTEISCKNLWVNDCSPKKQEEARAYITKADRLEDYRIALQKFAEMDIDLREKIFGSYKLADIAKMQPEEFINKINEYNYIPQTGEIWETASREKVVVVSVGIGEVNFYSSRATQKGCSEEMSLADFKKIFHNTGKTCDTLIAFFEELNALNGIMYFE